MHAVFGSLGKTVDLCGRKPAAVTRVLKPQPSARKKGPSDAGCQRSGERGASHCSWEVTSKAACWQPHEIMFTRPEASVYLLSSWPHSDNLILGLSGFTVHHAPSSAHSSYRVFPTWPSITFDNYTNFTSVFRSIISFPNPFSPSGSEAR